MSSPVVARWEISRRLSTRRRQLGLDVKTITQALGFTRNYWSAVENNRTLIAEEKLKQLFGVLDFSEPEQGELLALRQTSRQRGWWDEFPDLDEESKWFFGMEAGATRIRAYEGHLIPGLVQIEPYARAVLEVDPAIRPVDVDGLTAVRHQRQQQLWEHTRPDFVVIVSEAALRQQVAGPQVQADQLRYLGELADPDDGRAEVRVLPLDQNPGIIASSSTLVFFQYESPHLPIVAWQEAVRWFGAVPDDDRRFPQLDLAWSNGLERALAPPASRQMIIDIAEEMAALA